METRITKIIGRVIALIDQHTNYLVNNILHHADFQNLEACWRGLFMLVKEANDNHRVLIRMLNVSCAELKRDITNAIEFDQSQIFKKIYSAEYGQPGGLPYGLLIGDYYFSHNGMGLLSGMAEIAAAAFVPFVASITPAFFGLNEFTEFQPQLQVDDIVKLPEYQRWKKLRTEQDASFLGLALPRILLRAPYNADGIKITQRFFREKITHHNDYLWGNACYAFACAVISCFKETGWFADIRGRYMPGVIECRFTDRQERMLSEAGFLAMRYNRMLEQSVFYSSQSVQQSAMLHYVLCAARFAHYIKVIARDKIGKFFSAEDCEHYLAKWLQKYCSATQRESDIAGARYPLSAARVEVREQQGNPGKYYCVIHLRPQYQLDGIEASLKLSTEIKM